MLKEKTVGCNALLGLLLERPRHGYELAREFSSEGEFAEVLRLGRSQLYALLRELEAEGAVTGEHVGGGPGPARRVLRATPRGRASFLEWAGTPASSVHGLRVEFLLKFALLGRTGGGQGALLQAQRAVLQRKLEELTAAHGVAGPIAEDLTGLRRRLLEAGLGWLEGLGARKVAP